MDSLKKTIEAANITIEKTVKNVETIYSISGISERLNVLRDSLSKSNPLSMVFDDFTKTISEQLLIFKEKIAGEETIDTWLFSSVNEYYRKTSKEFMNNNAFITKFEFFGNILNKTFDALLKSKEYIERFKTDYEIYAVLVLPPERFLNYKGGKKSDSDWDQFLWSCIKATKSELIIKRHFLTINYHEKDEENVIKYFGAESKSLKKNDFIRQLNKKFGVIKDRSCNAEQLIYTSLDGEGDKMFSEVDENTNANYKNESLSEILSIMHNNNSCKVIELDILNTFEANAEENLKKLNEILWDSIHHKALDYFAIREKKGKKNWVFCFKTVYDETFDFAHVQIYHKNQSSKDKWNDICSDLNKVFLTDKDEDNEGILKDEKLGINIYPILKYK